MFEERRRSSRWRRWRKRIFLSALAAPVVLVVAADLVLCSPWPRRWVAGKISRRLGLETSIGPIFWTPWSGLVVKDVRIDPPDELRESIGGPVLQTGEIQVETDWWSTLRGRPALRRICINEPDLTLTPGLLSAIAAARKQAQPEEEKPVPAEPAAEAPPLAAAPPVASPAPVFPEADVPSLPPLAHNDTVAEPVAGSVASPETPVAPGATHPGPASPPAAQPAPPAPPPADTRPGTTVEVRGAHFRMLNPKGGAPLVETNGLSLRLPIQGPDADGRIELKSLQVLDHPLIESLDFPLQWRSPELQIVQQHFSFTGMDVEVSLRTARQPGLPFIAEVRVPGQAMPLWEGPLDRKLSAKRIEAVLRVSGSLPGPATWQGGGGARFENLRVESDERTVVFTRGDVFGGIQPGFALRVPDARLIGEEFSLLGNGFLHPSDGKAAVLRWVAPPEVLNNWAQKAKELDPALDPCIVAMETPERAMIDFSLVSSGEELGVELGTGGPVVSVGVFFSLLGH